MCGCEGVECWWGYHFVPIPIGCMMLTQTALVNSDDAGFIGGNIKIWFHLLSFLKTEQG